MGAKRDLKGRNKGYNVFLKCERYLQEILRDRLRKEKQGFIKASLFHG